MRDLKHLIYFESLLENADNDLVKQAQAEGKLAIGSTVTLRVNRVYLLPYA